MRRNLARLLRPASIAIVGASPREGSFGTRLLASIRSGPYGGKIYPINPRYKEIEGLTCYPSLAEVPERIDLATFAVSDDIIEDALQAAADAGVAGAAIFGRAYEPEANDRPAKYERLGAIARAANMAVVGNNCMGFINFVDRVKISGNPPPIPNGYGAVGLVSHSGSTWSGLIGNQRDLLFNYAISAGQEIATGVADYFEFLLDQPETRVIACVLETVRNPERFLAALERADRQGVPVVVLKLGRSERGRSFALAHSGALAGSDAAYGAVFERHNVIRVFTPDELTDTVELLAAPRQPKAGGGIGIVTDSGGERELISDIATDLNAPIATITPETSQKLVEILDPGMAAVNPVDAYGDGKFLLGEALRALADDPNVAIATIATNLVHGRPYLKSCGEALEQVHKTTDKPVAVFGNLHSTISRTEATRLRGLGIPVLMGTTTSLAAMSHAIGWHTRRAARGATPPIARTGAEAPAAVKALAAKGEPGRALAPEAAYAILDHYGVAAAPSVFVISADDATAAAGRLGYPVVLKTAAADILHKTEKGGVAVGLANSEQVRMAYQRIAKACGPEIQVQKQAAAGVEILLGMTTDPQFGPMLTIGLGGVLTEILADVVTLVPPLDAKGAQAALARLKGYPLLTGFRGKPTADMAALTETIVGFGRLCADAGGLFSEVDVNPVIAGPDGAVAVDVLMVRAAAR